MREDDTRTRQKEYKISIGEEIKLQTINPFSPTQEG